MKNFYLTFLLFLFFGNLYGQNNAPIANYDSYLIDLEETLLADVTDNDFDADDDAIFIQDIIDFDDATGSLTVIDEETIEYIPAMGFQGQSIFDYVLCDDGDPSLCDTATVIINVENLPAPISEYKYWIRLSDKDGTAFSTDNPSAFLSDKAIERRTKQEIDITIQDLPVNADYVTQIKNLDDKINVLHTSKWFNAVAISFEDSTKIILEDLMALNFVTDTILLANQLTGKTAQEKLVSEEHGVAVTSFDETYYGATFHQTDMLNGTTLHNNGFTGEGMIIFVLDNGFRGIDTLEAFQHMFDEGRFLGGWDVVNLDNDVFGSGSHGTRVLSTMAAFLPDVFVGTAPDASYYLAITEAPAEQRIEEINWIVAAEFADSLGADILTTSLGYSDFDGTVFDYTYEDMNGDNTFITRGADIAASKGMLVINSAGNSGNDDWLYITAPGDGDSVLTVGAVLADSTLADFSSNGPSFDGRIKPDVMAQGDSTALVFSSGDIIYQNGTSFSAPIIAGMSACLWQSNPDATATEIREATIQSASQYATPDSLFGYGIPNYEVAFTLLDNSTALVPNPLDVMAFPNPFYNDFEVFFWSEQAGDLLLQLVDINGRTISSSTQIVKEGKMNRFHIDDLTNYPKGIYLLRITIADEQHVLKLSKLED